MKIERITVCNEDGNGTLVKLRLRLSSAEDFNSVSVSRVIAAINGDAPVSHDPERPEDAMRRAEEKLTPTEFLGEIERNRVREEVAEAGAESPTDPSPPTETGGSRRRRRGASAESDQSNSAETTAGPSAGATITSSEPEGGNSAANPTRRRRSAGTATTADGSTETSASAPAPQATESEPRRRRRAADATPTATTTVGETTTPEPRRNRRGGADTAAASPSASPTVSPSEDKITDADLSKACSDAARVLTPKVVMEHLKTFGVSQAGEVKAEDRRRFLDGLKAAKEAA